MKNEPIVADDAKKNPYLRVYSLPLPQSQHRRLQNCLETLNI